jgi:hypothetical protein
MSPVIRCPVPVKARLPDEMVLPVVLRLLIVVAPPEEI